MAGSSAGSTRSRRLSRGDDRPPPGHRVDHGGARGGRLVRPAGRRHRRRRAAPRSSRHNRDEEKEHAAMTLEWLRRHDPELDEHLRTYLFTDGDVLDDRGGGRARRRRRPDGARRRRLARHRQPASEQIAEGWPMNHLLPRAGADLRRRPGTRSTPRPRARLTHFLAARKLVDFDGPLGWDARRRQPRSGRALPPTPPPGVQAARASVQPLVELRAASASPRRARRDRPWRARSRPRRRSSTPPGASPLAEDNLRVQRLRRGGIDGHHRGVAARRRSRCPTTSTASRPPSPRRSASCARPASAGRTPSPSGPARTPASPRRPNGGYPVLEHVRLILDGPVVWAPAVEGAVVLSVRGGDFELTFGQDLSIGYVDHDADAVQLYLEESLTFRALTPEAAVAIVAVLSPAGGHASGADPREGDHAHDPVPRDRRHPASSGGQW